MTRLASEFFPVGWLWQVRGVVNYFHLDGKEHKFYNLWKENAL